MDKVEEIVLTGEFADIIHGNDEIDNPISVFCAENGKIIEEYTDEFGWPNTTHTGKVMYENTHFRMKREAIERGISESEAAIQNLNEAILGLEKEIKRKKRYLNKVKGELWDYRYMLDGMD